MFKKMLLVFFLTVIFPYASFADGRYVEVSCSLYGSNGTGCDQCFDGGAKYVGDVFTPDDYFRAGSQDRVYWQKENLTRYEVRVLNNNTSWYVSNDLLGYPPTFLWDQANNGDRYHIFRAGTNVRFLSTKPGKGIKLENVSNNNVDPNRPAMRFTFLANYRDFLGQGQQGPLQTHKECVFYKPRYCGDGILQRDKGEVCDPNDPNRVGWGSGGCDANTCQPIVNPSCNELTVNPNSGEAPLNVTATCEGFRVNTWQIDCGNGQTFSGNGNNSGTQTFSRTCNYESAGQFTPRCTINGSITNNSCRKTVNVSSPLEPSILIDKRDDNIHDLDGIRGNDTQTVYIGEDAVFRIRVTNNGNEILRNIRLLDPRASACATAVGTSVDLQNNRFTNRNNQTVTITQGGAGNKNDNRLSPGEWFEYTCSEPDSQSNYTNIADVRGIGVSTGTQVTDSDPTEIIVIARQNPRIEVDKRDANPDDLDGNIGGNDSQTVRRGERAVFSIVITNNGSENLRNIRLIDERAPACATADGTFVDLQNKRFTNKLGEVIQLDVFGQGNHNDNILQVGEKFSYVCEEPNTQSNYINIVEVIGTGVTSGETVRDDDSTAVIIDTNPSIQVTKLDANPNDLDGEQFNDTQTVLLGTEAIFQITVVNNGSENLRNIRLIDERAPACATADGTFVDLQNKRFTNKLGEVIDIFPSGQGNHNNSILEVGEEFFYTCARDNTLEDYINIVEVIGTGVTSGETVRDDDNTEVLVSTDDEESACIGLTASPRSAQTSLTSTLTCTGSNATSFRIEVRNPSGDIVNTINNATGQVTLPLIGNSNTNYTASCFVNNETTAIPACQTTLTVTRGGGGGGGADFACNEIIRNGNSYRCIGTGGQMNQFGIVYNIPGESEKQSQVASAQNLTSFQGRRFADFTLPAGATNAQCYSANVGDTTRVGIGDTWRTSLACEYRPGGGGGGGPICGDGIINQPTEECDLGPLNGQPGSTCTADCKIVRTTPIPQCKDLPDSIRSQICGIETIPGESVYSFGPSGTVIIGHGRNPLYELRGIPSFKNNSIHDVAFDKICVSSDPNSGTQNPLIINDGSLTNQEICVDIEGRKIYPYEEIFIVRQGNNYVVRNQYSNITRDDQGIYPVFLGDKDGIPASARDYGTANVRTSVYSRIQNNQGNLQSFSFYHTFLSGNVNVRVARPAVSTVGGGTSFVKSTTTSDVAQVTQGIGSIINNTNFVGTSVSSSGVSSDAGVVTDTDASSGDSDMQSGTDVITQTTPTTNFESYNDLDNVFIKSGPHTFSGTPSGNGARTYIIENGDVTISGNITSSDNIAIIVRNGTINIKSNVTQVNATLMILGNGIITGEATDKQLRVNGALYGNIDQLIANRYYIDGSGSSLSVGTIVSFGSNLLRRPAPLLSQFVGEYLDSQRVAR